MIANLRNVVARLDWCPSGTEWADYYATHSYSDQAFREKQRTVRQSIERLAPATVWDIGANTGVFSRVAAEFGANVCAFDIDPACVELNYRSCRDKRDSNILPLYLDLTNPTPSTGWAHSERESLADRGPVDTVLALALIHHLAISNNLPLGHIARFFRHLCRNLIIEFVPKSDPQVQRLLRSREDIFPHYHQAGFEKAFGQHFEILDAQPVGRDGRVIYVLNGGRHPEQL